MLFRSGEGQQRQHSSWSAEWAESDDSEDDSDYLPSAESESTSSSSSSRIPLPDLREVYVLGDGCAAMSREEHDRAMFVAIPLSATVITCAEYLRKVVKLEQQPPLSRCKNRREDDGYVPSFWAKHGTLIYLSVIILVWALWKAK